ncbi:MAG: hypothetical protein MJ252_04490, partial [archaeon]|nr:hypothetical protein [archaeon]
SIFMNQSESKKFVVEQITEKNGSLKFLESDRIVTYNIESQNYSENKKKNIEVTKEIQQRIKESVSNEKSIEDLIRCILELAEFFPKIKEAIELFMDQKILEALNLLVQIIAEGYPLLKECLA